MKNIKTSYVLLTRPEEESHRLALQIKDQTGRDSLICPMMDIRICAQNKTQPDFSASSACLFTSQQAVKALSDLHIRIPPDMRIFAIGESTAKELKQAGYTQIHVADGTSEKLCADMADILKGNERPVFHFCGAHTSCVLRQNIQDYHVNVRSWPVYEATARKSIPEKVLQELKEGNISDIMFYSARTAHLFKALCQSYEIETCFTRTRGLCLSQAVVKSVKQLPWQEIKVAHTPSTYAMLELLAKET